MAKVLLSLILLVTFMTATAAELSCSCVEETGIHQEKKDSASDHKDHCQHTCTQCHFAAVVPKVFLLKASDSISTLTFNSIQVTLVKFSSTHFRPPIA